jgi:hypothetical protein
MVKPPTKPPILGKPNQQLTIQIALKERDHNGRLVHIGSKTITAWNQPGATISLDSVYRQITECLKEK